MGDWSPEVIYRTALQQTERGSCLRKELELIHAITESPEPKGDVLKFRPMFCFYLSV